MLIGEYLKAAAAQVHKAAYAAKTEADDFRRQIIEKEREVTREVRSLEENVKQMRNELRSSVSDDNPGNIMATQMGTIGALEEKIKSLQRNFEQEKQQLNQQAQEMENQMHALTSKAQELERSAM